MLVYIALAIAVIATLVGWKFLMERKTKREMEAYRSIPPVAPSNPPIATRDQARAGS